MALLRTATAIPRQPIGIGTVFAVSVGTVSPWPSRNNWNCDPHAYLTEDGKPLRMVAAAAASGFGHCSKGFASRSHRLKSVEVAILNDEPRQKRKAQNADYAKSGDKQRQTVSGVVASGVNVPPSAPSKKNGTETPRISAACCNRSVDHRAGDEHMDPAVSLLAPPAARDETEGRRRAGLYSWTGSNEIELSSVDLASR